MSPPHACVSNAMKTPSESDSSHGPPVAVVPFRQSRGRDFHGEFRQQPLLLGNVSADN
jgi:hypothetical protein